MNITTMYKNKIFTVVLLLLMAAQAGFFMGCSSGNAETGNDLESKKALLVQKQNELEDLKFEIKKLESEIVELDPEFKKREEERKARFVTVKTVERKTFETYNEFQGNIETKGSFMVSGEAGGRLVSLTPKEGERVTKGQLIGKVDDSIMRTNMEELYTALNLAKDVYGRREKLWKQNIGSEMEYLKAKNDVESLERKIATLQAQMQKVNIYSPVSGIVETIFIKQGEMAGAGSPIMSVINTSTVQVAVEIPETYLKNVRRGNRVEINIPALEYTRTARIGKIGEMINPTNRTFEVEISLSNSSGKLKPNLMAMVKIKDTSEKDAVVVPVNLVLNGSEGDYVFIAVEGEDGNKRAKKVLVETGTTYNGGTHILNGLEGGEWLIEEGSRTLTDGELLKITGEQPDAKI